MPADSPRAAVRALLRSPTSVLADVTRDFDGHERLLVRGDASGTMQLSELIGSECLVLTDLPEPVGGAHYVPGRRLAVLEIDQGGNERHGLWLLDLDAAITGPVGELAALRALAVDPAFVHRFAGASPDGRSIVYVSNRAGGIDFDLWTVALATGEHRLVHAGGTWYQPSSGFSPDGRRVAVLAPGPRPLDDDLVLIDVDTGTSVTPLPHPQEAALVGSPAWIDADRFVVSANVGRDFMALVRHELTTGITTDLANRRVDVDAEVVASADGSTLLVIENCDGASVMSLVDSITGAERRQIPIPEAGVVSASAISPPILSADGARVYFTLSTPRMAGEIFMFTAATGQTSRLTDATGGVSVERLARPESHLVESFDGESVPVFVYRPRSDAPRAPVVVLVHGGPEAQSLQMFNPIIQGLVLAGFGVVVPNVRGSTGYGRRFASLDDTIRRLDAVRDLASVHSFLDSAGFDRNRAAIWGGSYGGYMTLAALAFQPELWAAGVDIVGISNLVTFLQNTSAYRRAHREREYGSLARDRAFLESASPLNRVEQIRAPLFVIHGRNDPRVPVTETEQLVSSLRQRGVRCELRIYEDEGHGLARLANRLDAYPDAVEFLREVLRPED